ncbi:hypothetical protein QR46_4248 [Giardia duodenalis assemblage B]|uniref:Uncharacterized protein n=1 Tax=Giardia duodenalis assemblage B TaxID=1394984 RepID=A0A132NP35_GIAIN|nr:hypothetical protein QR46_4248 [Giardia intestinalis assemblage B]
MSVVSQQLQAAEERWNREREAMGQLLERLSTSAANKGFDGHVSQSSLSELYALQTFKKVAEILLYAAEAMFSVFGLLDSSESQMLTELQEQASVLSASTQAFEEFTAKEHHCPSYCSQKYTSEQLALVYLVLLDLQPCILHSSIVKIFSAGSMSLQKDSDPSTESAIRTLRNYMRAFLSFCRIHLVVSYSLYNTQRNHYPDDWLIQKEHHVTHDNLNLLSIHILVLAQLDLVLKAILPYTEAFEIVTGLCDDNTTSNFSIVHSTDLSTLHKLSFLYGGSFMRTILHYFHYIRAKIYTDSFAPDREGKRKQISWMFVELNVIASNLAQSGLEVAKTDIDVILNHADQYFSEIARTFLHQSLTIRGFLHGLTTSQLTIDHITRNSQNSLLFFYSALVKFYKTLHVSACDTDHGATLSSQPFISELAVTTCYSALHNMASTHLLTCYLFIIIGFVEAFGIIMCLSIESSVFDESTLDNLCTLATQANILLREREPSSLQHAYPSSITPIFDHYRINETILKPLFAGDSVELSTVRACDLMFDGIRDMMTLFSELCDSRLIRIQTAGSILASAWVLVGELPSTHAACLLTSIDSAILNTSDPMSTLYKPVSTAINGVTSFLVTRIRYSLLSEPAEAFYRQHVTRLFSIKTEQDIHGGAQTPLFYESSSIVSQGCEQSFLMYYTLLQAEAIVIVLKSFTKNRDIYRFHSMKWIGFSSLIMLLMGSAYVDGLNKLSAGDKLSDSMFSKVIFYESAPLQGGSYVGLDSKGLTTLSDNNPSCDYTSDPQHNSAIALFSSWIEQVHTIESYFRLFNMMSTSSALRETFFNYIILNLKVYLHNLDLFCSTFEHVYSAFSGELYTDSSSSFSLPGTLKEEGERLHRDAKKFGSLVGRKYAEYIHALVNTAKSIKQISTRYIEVMDTEESIKLRMLERQVKAVSKSCTRCASLCIFLHSINSILAVMLDFETLKRYYSTSSVKLAGTLPFPANVSYVLQDFSGELARQEIAIGFVSFLDSWLLRYGILTQLHRTRDPQRVSQMLQRIKNLLDEFKYVKASMLQGCNTAMDICERILSSAKRYDGKNLADYCKQTWGIDASCIPGPLLTELFLSIYQCMDDKSRL